MLYQIHMMGNLRRGPERELYDRYAKRLGKSLALHEHEDKNSIADLQKLERFMTSIFENLPTGACRIALDERGKAFSTQQLFEVLEQKSLQGLSPMCFFIGGADGHPPLVRQQAHLVLQLSSLTLPHQLVPAVLVEQIYRIHTMHKGHPYHR